MAQASSGLEFFGIFKLSMLLLERIARRGSASKLLWGSVGPTAGACRRTLRNSAEPNPPLFAPVPGWLRSLLMHVEAIRQELQRGGLGRAQRTRGNMGGEVHA